MKDIKSRKMQEGNLCAIRRKLATKGYKNLTQTVSASRQPAQQTLIRIQSRCDWRDNPIDLLPETCSNSIGGVVVSMHCPKALPVQQVVRADVLIL